MATEQNSKKSLQEDQMIDIAVNLVKSRWTVPAIQRKVAKLILQKYIL
jgi:hypothetical protein